MRDLELSRLIDAGAATADDLRPLVGCTLATRAPYLARLVTLTTHADPQLRVAAISGLAGARGMRAVRAMVALLDDDDAAVRAAAVAALHVTAREAPVRFAHALFHARPDVRRAAASDVPSQAAELAAYLRADPETADVVRDAPWPAQKLPLVFDLFAAGTLSAAQFVRALAWSPPVELRAFFEREPGRRAPEIDAYLAALAGGAALMRPPGSDAWDLAWRGVAEAGTYDRELDLLIITATSGRKFDAFSRSAITALLGQLARDPRPELWGALAALEPRALEWTCFARDAADAVAAALIRTSWPVRPHQVRALALPWVRADLAVAAAVAGLLPNKRLAQLAKALDETTILDGLLRSDRGWSQICQLPPEAPPLELRWLSQIERTRPDRCAELAGIALGVWSGKRLEKFIDYLQRERRPHALIALVQRTGIAPDDPRLLSAAAMLSSRIDRGGYAEVLATLLSGSPREVLCALVVIRSITDKIFLAAATPLTDAQLLRIVEVVDTADGAAALPRDRELVLAQIARERSHARLRAWAKAVSVVETPVTPLPRVRTQRTLAPEEVALIGAVTPAQLDTLLEPMTHAPTAGLAEALARRVARPSVLACVALLGCPDPLPDVAVQLDRYALREPAFERELDVATAAAWGTHDVSTGLSPLIYARLWRWEQHLAQLQAWVAQLGGVHPALLALEPIEGWLATSTLWRGLAEVLMFARYRDRERFLAQGTPALAQHAAQRVATAVGVDASRICVALVEGGAVSVDIIRATLLDLAADAPQHVRDELARLVRLDGLPVPPRTIDLVMTSTQLIAKIRASRELDILEQYCADARVAVVQEAALVMAAAGELGQLRLARLLPRIAELAAPVGILESIALWDCEEALASARELAHRADLPPEWQFHLCLGLGDYGRAIATVQIVTTGWFRRGDWDTLVEHVPERTVALALITSPHHHAYARAVAVLLEQWTATDTQLHAGLRAFLEVDAARPLHLRRDVARRLASELGDSRGLEILVEDLAETGPGNGTWLRALAPHVKLLLARGITDAALTGGHAACSENRMLDVLRALHLDLDVAAPLYATILDEAMTQKVRQHASAYAIAGTLTGERLTAVAQVFAWGIRRGVELAGRLFRFHLTSKETDLGHTFLDGNRIFVSPLPMLRGEQHGNDVVEGLVLHEIGHHVYHRGEEAAALWKQAHSEGVGHLLNLIADEHLERNLRAVDSSYGDRLKRLDAYAFQHAPQEMKLQGLLDVLRGAAASALIASELGVGFDEDSVRFRRGSILAALERAGHPLARFARALRMGLGNRTGDPLVARALELCGKDLRKLDMRGLYELTHQVAALMGGAVSIAKVFGGSEGIEDGERDSDVYGSLDDDALQREVERILDPRRSSSSSPASGPPRLAINVAPDAEFARIANVRKVSGNKDAHRAIVHEVHRHSVRLRTHLDELGLRWQPVKARTKGHALDRGRLRPLLTHGDPRILQARAPQRRTDLFLGTLIDCSGSMQIGQNLERARKFAVLIAEAVRQLPGVEARFFGFTDSTIFDAGDAADCHVTALETSGGNNDAAALHYAASLALTSRKRARVLVMISDGLPTECSVDALRGLVTTLTKRKGIVCAQVAVRALEEVCFPHYVVLDDEAIDAAVAKFGRMIGDLTRKALAM